jgi:hypothetical protein
MNETILSLMKLKPDTYLLDVEGLKQYARLASTINRLDTEYFYAINMKLNTLTKSKK